MTGAGMPEGPPRGVATMSVVRWLLVAVTALVAVGSIVSYFNAGRGGGASGTTTAPVQLYTCPMHPQIIQDHPGSCPICNMTLVPKLSGSGKAPAADAAAGVAGLTAIELTPERIQLIGMRTGTVKREALGGELRATGTIVASERGLAQITTRFAGWVQKLLVSATGERVHKGQVLATIYSPEVLRAEQELLVARGWSGQDSAGSGCSGSRHRRSTTSSAPASSPKRSRSARRSKATWWRRTPSRAWPFNRGPCCSRSPTCRRCGSTRRSTSRTSRAFTSARRPAWS
jgi:hypothetical protein